MEKDNGFVIFCCPHCDQMIEVKNVNCAIFRCGMFKTGNQIPPHESKILCDRYVEEDLIYGCGKPFQLIPNNEEYEVYKCNYI